MKKGVILIIFSLIILSSIAFAREDDKNIDISSYIENLDSVKTQLNSNMGSLPGVAKKFLKNEKINIRIEMNNGEISDIYSIIKNSQVEKLEKGSLENPDYEISLKEKDIGEIADSDNPKNTFKKKLNSGDISLKANGFFKKMKLKMLKSFL